MKNKIKSILFSVIWDFIIILLFGFVLSFLNSWAYFNFPVSNIPKDVFSKWTHWTVAIEIILFTVFLIVYSLLFNFWKIKSKESVFNLPKTYTAVRKWSVWPSFPAGLVPFVLLLVWRIEGPYKFRYFFLFLYKIWPWIVFPFVVVFLFQFFSWLAIFLDSLFSFPVIAKYLPIGRRGGSIYG